MNDLLSITLVVSDLTMHHEKKIKSIIFFIALRKLNLK